MKKLLCSAAVCGLALAATPAQAEDGLKLEAGGHMKAYGVWIDQDEVGSADARNVDIIRNTEIHFGGETTLDNGLTVGVHFETDADQGDSLGVQESYAYFSGTWGRVNFGAEDGAAYLLQVEAPSADDNVDGIRQFVNPLNYTVAGSSTLGSFVSTGVGGGGGLGYAQDQSGDSDKITYLSPIMNGFQVGLSYTPEVTDEFDIDSTSDSSGSATFGVRTDDVADEYGSAYEIGARYEGQFNNVGVIAGAGFTQVDLEDDGGGSNDDEQIWNAGLDLDIGPFGIGAIYLNDDLGNTGIGDDEEETWVVGVDYTTGPFKLGASYMNQDNTGGITGNDGTDGIDTDRWTGGVIYTYGPGMTFRGSVSHVSHDNVNLTGSTEDSIDATSVLLGTQINF